MKTDLTKKKCFRVPGTTFDASKSRTPKKSAVMLEVSKFIHRIPLVGAGLLLVFIFAQTVWAQSGLVVKLYPCPQGQAAATADALRNDYGAIPGVRVAADERTSQVIIQAPPEVQARVSQRLAAAFPGLQPAADKAPAGGGEVRQVPLKRIQADQLEAALWSTLGNRLTAIQGQPAQPHGYHLALSNGGAVTIWIDFSTKQVKLEGSATAVDAAVRLIQVLDSPQDAAGRNVRVMPLQPAQVASVQRAASIMRTANGAPPVALPLAALLMQPRPDTPPAGGTSPSRLPPIPTAPPVSTANPEASAEPGARLGEKPAELGNLSRIVNPVQMEMIDGLDVLVLRGNTQDVEQLMEVVRQIERLSPETEPAIEVLMMKHVDCEAMATLVKALYDEVYLARQGTVSITPLVTPNAILIVGRPENVQTVKDLTARLDQPAVPGTQFQVFHLKYASATTAQTTIQNFFVDQRRLEPGGPRHRRRAVDL